MIELLRHLISVPSPSRDEGATASVIYEYLEARGGAPRRIGNNVWALAAGYDPAKPTLMLNSHHDTVRPAPSYTIDPYCAIVADGRIYGLGSNDAGASVVSLIHTFLSLKDTPLPFNLLLAITAEEEVGGEGGMRLFLPSVAAEGISITCAIVGEPTGMQAAVAERGLLVFDCETSGVSGHAARGEGINAIYRAIADIDALRHARFPAVSEVLGPVGISITQIQAGTQHNVVPDSCRWVVDVRTTDVMTNEQTATFLQGLVSHSRLTPRSTRVRASVISPEHPLTRSAIDAGCGTFVSPTTSDMSLMHDFPSLKIGPGDSARSHRADEYILISELEQAPSIYRQIITHLKL